MTGVDFSEIIFVMRVLLVLFRTCLGELGEGGTRLAILELEGLFCKFGNSCMESYGSTRSFFPVLLSEHNPNPRVLRPPSPYQQSPPPPPP